DTGGRAPVRGAPVLLVGAEQADAALRRLVAGERPRAMAGGETGEDGRLVFEDLAAGAYAVVVAPRSAALAPVARAVPELAPGARHDLGQLSERLAATLIVATEVGEATGAAELLVDLTLAGDDSLLEGPWRQVQLLPGGSVAVEGLPPGSWRVELLALDRNGHLEPGGARTVELAEGETRVLAFAVPAVAETLLFHGRIVDDDGPQAGTSGEEESLAFFHLGVSWSGDGERGGGTSDTHSAKDGSFTIRLPGPGTYAVEWFDERRKQMVVVPDVRFEDPDEEVIVRVPRGRIEGRVVDEEGKAVREGSVEALGVDCEIGRECEIVRPTRDPSARVREDGSFALTRVAGGSYRLTARAEKGEVESDSQVVELPEEGRLTGVVLVLRRSRPLDLAFVSPEGLPLVAIGGQVLALRADGELDWHQFVTDARGQATVRLRGGVPGRALVLLDAPGRAIAGFRVDTGRAGPHRLVLPPTGSLVLRSGPRDARDPAVSDEGLGGAALLTGPLFLVGAEVTLPLGGLINVLQMGLPEGRLRLDGLAAGPWVLTRTPQDLLFPTLRGILRGDPLPGTPLASFQLEPGGEVVLDLGASAPADGP
ncbi:MAG TPA: carboxypeptidase-like regulatory domain-containing protein, partial [Thermoanaerobaculia bacterium]|nr:carboxypeptidase-like regulatory domain-containing protein [Thermoanaerobaculia bacterium]